MKKTFFVMLATVGSVLLFSCNNSSTQKESKNLQEKNRIEQQDDGTISLTVEKADCYQDTSNPASNTAEWSVFVSKAGRFKVWLSSATKDTTNLNYQHAVMLSILDNTLETKPACDKVIRNSADVDYPYFRADSFMGSLYIQDTGLYNIQVISEKIIPKDKVKPNVDDSRLISVSLTPEQQ